jgi:hypothetical protein
MSAAMVVAGLVATVTFPAITSSSPNDSKGFYWSSSLGFSLSLCSLLIFLPLQGVPPALLDSWLLGFLVAGIILLHFSVISCYLALIFHISDSQILGLPAASGIGLRELLATLLAIALLLTIVITIMVITKISKTKAPGDNLPFSSGQSGSHLGKSNTSRDEAELVNLSG